MSKKQTILFFTAVAIAATVLILSPIVPYDKDKYLKKEKARKIAEYEAAYVDYDEWAEGRVCPELRFGCLPESRDKSWQNQTLKDGLDAFELNTTVMERYHSIIKRWDHQRETDTWEKDMNIKLINRDFYDRVNAKRFLIEMEQSLEKEFPGFWRDAPKKVRYHWIRRAMNKAKKFGWQTEKPGLMVRLCARIGLDFDKDPKWTAITQFVAKDVKNNIDVAIDYIDWTVFDKTNDWTGTRITDWSMREAHPGLPYPKKPYPKLNENIEVYHKTYPKGAR